MFNRYGDSIKKAKGTKRCVIEIILIVYLISSQYYNHKKGFKSEAHTVYTGGINKIALSSNDDKRLQTFDRTARYSYGTNAFKVCESEILRKYKWLILMII